MTAMATRVRTVSEDAAQNARPAQIPVNLRRSRRRLLLLIFLVFAGAGYAGYVGLGLKARIGATRTPVPGERAVRLQASNYDVYFELPGDYTKYNEFYAPSDLRVSIAAPGERSMPLAGYRGLSYVGSTGSQGLAIDTVEIPHDGVYRIRTRWPGGAFNGATVVLGVPAGSAYIRLIVAGVIALLAFITLCILGPGTVSMLRSASEAGASGARAASASAS
jgi:hypothetical protein